MSFRARIPIPAPFADAPEFAPLTALALVAIVLVPLALMAPRAQAQFAGPGELPPIDGAMRAAIVDSVTAAIDSIYVLAEPAGRIVAGLRGKLAAGGYDAIRDPAEFALKLQEDAQAIRHDGHFGIRAMLPLDPALRDAQMEEDPAAAERELRLSRARNFGFRKAEILPGGVGYVRFDHFADGREAFETAAAVMNFVANTDAVILDLRQNGGGSASMIRFLAGYFLEENTHLINWDIRAEKKTVQSYSADFVPGRQILKQPLYILTSGNTFSAAEEFTFDLRNLERATVVGDTTGGGGHTVTGAIFDFKAFRIGIRLPYGRAYNPDNNEGWEGVGVEPHIAVPQELALEAACADALGKLIEAEKDEGYKMSLKWALADVEGRLKPLPLSSREMKMYAGHYGPRRVFAADGALFYQREDRPPFKLAPMGEDLFRVGDLDYFRVRFERDPSGKVVKLIGLYDDGSTDENPREGS